MLAPKTCIMPNLKARSESFRLERRCKFLFDLATEKEYLTKFKRDVTGNLTHAFLSSWWSNACSQIRTRKKSIEEKGIVRAKRDDYNKNKILGYIVIQHFVVLFTSWFAPNRVVI